MQEQLEERKLVSLAMAGDNQAFNELILRHRAKLLGWTRTMIRDRFQAEDIVQDALTKSYAQIGGLQHTDKFLPWVRRILRNEILMRLRKKEQEHLGGDEAIQSLADDSESIGSDPIVSIIQKQTTTMISALLEVLSKKERAVFDLHILAGFSVNETADALKMKPGAVYTHVSRARQKLLDERFRYEIRQYLEARTITNAAKVQAIRRGSMHWANGTYNSMVWIMAEMLQGVGEKGFRVTDLMGFTGHAFRIHAAADLGPSSAYGYDWAEIARRGWSNLGFVTRSVGRPGMSPMSPETQIKAIALIHEALSQGCPVMGWNLSGNGFGLIYGFNDDTGMFTIMDTSALGKQLPYDKLGRASDFSELYVATVTR